MDEDEAGELVDGVLVEEEMPDWIHEDAVTWFIATFVLWLKDRDGHVGGSEVKFRVPRGGRKSDASVYLPGSRKPPRRGVVRTPPDILLEVISSSPRDERRDRVEKMDEYAAFGVRWYWLIDPVARLLEIYALDPTRGRYVRELGATEGKLDRIPGCDGLVVELDALWSRIDALPNETDGDRDDE